MACPRMAGALNSQSDNRCYYERVRQTETETDTHRQIDRETETDRHRQTQTHRDRQTEVLTQREINIQSIHVYNMSLCT